MIFEHACKLGLEGIVSKRIDLPYKAGPSKNLAEDQEQGAPGHEAVRGSAIVIVRLDRKATYEVTSANHIARGATIQWLISAKCVAPFRCRPRDHQM